MASANIALPALGDPWRLRDDELAGNIRIRQQIINRMHAEIGQLLAQVEVRGAKPTYGYGSTPAFLDDLTHIGYPAAKKLVDRALAVHPTHGPGGTELPACAPLTGAAAAEGVIGTTQVDAVVAVLQALPATVTQPDRAGAEKILVDLARHAGPREIARAGRRILDTIDPDGPALKDPAPARVRELRIQAHRDGTATLKALLDPATHATLRSVIDPLAIPHPATPEEGRDTRSHAERQGDALAEVLSLALGSPELPTHAGDRTHIVVTLNYTDLQASIGTACLDLAGTITATEARLLACDARIIPAVLGTQGEPLDVGRAHRLVTPAQRRALTLRDAGCAFPGCERPPKHCDAHHIVTWINGGDTNLANLTLLCGRHHRLIHTSPWEIRIAADGKPDFIPPHYLDPLQQPRRNTFHTTQGPPIHQAA